MASCHQKKGDQERPLSMEGGEGFKPRGERLDGGGRKEEGCFSRVRRRNNSQHQKKAAHYRPLGGKDGRVKTSGMGKGGRGTKDEIGAVRDFKLAGNKKEGSRSSVATERKSGGGKEGKQKGSPR